MKTTFSSEVIYILMKLQVKYMFWILFKLKCKPLSLYVNRETKEEAKSLFSDLILEYELTESIYTL